ASGNVDLALSYQPQIIIAAAEGIPLKAAGRLVGSPLTTLLFIRGRGIESPSDLKGKTIGYTVPGMMDHLTEAFAAINGIDEYTTVNVGFSILQSLASGTVDAVMGPFKNYEPVSLEMEGFDPGYFEIERWGIPVYDELVFVTGASAYETKKDALVRFMDTIEKAIAFTAERPEEALALYFKAVPDAPKDMERAAFERTLPFFGPDTLLDPARWRTFAAFALRHGMIQKEVNTDEIVVAR
ncbi:MAG TPA: ABC transporter substrate-binding protein, partial [Synergistaceae bacterium]|nr:ABC transporter substrate-binding protein [Synergistaceae bacterium]